MRDDIYNCVRALQIYIYIFIHLLSHNIIVTSFFFLLSGILLHCFKDINIVTSQ